MKVLIIGSGGREHALCQTFKRNQIVTKIFCADGSAGISEIAECVNIKPDNIADLTQFALENRIDLTFVGGETALALGIVDEFEKHHLKIIGVGKKAARLESSKSFAKDFMTRHNIPTAAYAVADSPRQAVEILRGGKFGDKHSPVVVKADGLAAGKGVVVAANRAEAEQAINELENLVGKEAVAKIVLEECLIGREVSLLMFAAGENFALMPPVRDHKRIFEMDEGANTGGMGTITGANLLTEKEISEISAEIIEPTLQGCREEGFPFRGILFLGLMMTGTGVKLLEYNVRFGDPEAQAILVRLKTDLLEICEAMASRTLDKINVEWQAGSSACVVLASKGYPNKPVTGDVISGLEKSFEDVTIFHAGTKKDSDGKIITNGGRVLGVTASAKTLDKAIEKAYRAVGEISWNGMQYRRDIGK
ncbi:MAG: phosphoribosylamine--glycine ligase [Pyrinomonadaceae bacterium]|nr:phosphoribosylamine--glycine ligase [Pyrinomonadaceae bacterium]